MVLNYKGKKKEKEILERKFDTKFTLVKGTANAKSKLIQGENERVLHYLLSECNLRNKIDCIYIDPPFSTRNIFTITEEKASTISRIADGAIAYRDDLEGNEYLEFLRERLILLKELMSSKGSIYLHIDYKIGHYVKVLMDEIFGEENFRNDLTRIKCNPKNFPRKSFGNIKDMILYYTKSNSYIWNEPLIELNDEDIKRLYKKVDQDGRRYTTIPLHAPGETKNGATGQKWKGLLPPKGRHWRVPPEELDKLEKQGLIEWSKNNVPRKKIFADEHRGKRVQDIIEYKDPQNPAYPTEKNSDLLKLLITTSSNKDSTVLDCFCGSGTTLKTAQELGRNWIGIDESEKAIEITLNRLFDSKLPKIEDIEILKEIKN